MIFPKPFRVFESDCFEVVSRNISARYISLIHDGEKWSAHRLSYNLNITSIPRCPVNKKSGFVLHHCDNSRCINPDHLYLGTAKQNAIDMYERFPGIREKRSSENKGKKISEISRKKMSDSHKGKALSEEQKKNISNSLKGRSRPESVKLKISNSKLGKSFSQEHKENLSKARRKFLERGES